MKTIRKAIFPLLLALALTAQLAAPALAVDRAALQSEVECTAAHLLTTVKSPQVGSLGGEWAVLGLARSGCAVPDTYYQDYYAAVEACVAACKGVLHEKKYTEYSRVIVALTAIGKNPADVAGYNLLIPLGDYDKTVWQGLNGPIWALIALDAGGYEIPQNPAAATQATRQLYLDEILRRQHSDGGWSLTDADAAADADITAMALQALAKYQSQPAVKAASDRALACLSAMQERSGGFTSRNTANAESVAQVIVALCELGVSLDDSRFVKNGGTLLASLLSYRRSDGSFAHTASGAGSQMSSEQGLYALAAALRAADGSPSLYRMTDAASAADSTAAPTGAGLAGKNATVTPVPVTAPGATFADIAHSENRTAIEALSARGILTGRTRTLFDPGAQLTRAEFAAIAVRGLGLRESTAAAFSDVAPDSWYAGYVGCANAFGIINGVGGGQFAPGGTLTRQEAAVMVARAAALCGMDTALSAAAVRDTLAQFGDYTAVASWAQAGLAFCYQAGILDQSAREIAPAAPISRCELAQMLFNLLTKADLL